MDPSVLDRRHIVDKHLGRCVPAGDAGDPGGDRYLFFRRELFRRICLVDDGGRGCVFDLLKQGYTGRTSSYDENIFPNYQYK